VLAAQVAADPHQPQRRQAQGEFGDCRQIRRQDPLAQITEFHHQQHAMAPPLAQGRRCQGFDYHGFAVAAGGGMGHDPFHLAEHGRADQQQWSCDARMRHGFNRFEA